MSRDSLAGVRIFLSASVPDELNKNEQKLQDRLHLISALTEQIFKKNGTLVYGGHPSVTPLIHQTAVNMLSGAKGAAASVDLFQLGGFRAQAPSQVSDLRVFPSVTWVGSHSPSQKQAFEDELDEMRKLMVRGASAAVFAGGKMHGYLGKQPGIRREYDLFVKEHPGQPVYLVGLLDGETAKIVAENESTGAREHNGLNEAELWALHHSDQVDIAISLIVDDLLSYAAKKGTAGPGGASP